MRHYANSRSFEDLFIACICTTAVTPLCYDQKATNVSQLTQFAYHNHTPWYRGNLWVTFGRSSSTWTMYVLDFFHWKKKGGFSIVLSRKFLTWWGETARTARLWTSPSHGNNCILLENFKDHLVHCKTGQLTEHCNTPTAHLLTMPLALVCFAKLVL